MASLTFQNFIFFWSLDAPRPDFVQMQKSLNVWKGICLEAKHVGAHLMDQLKKKCEALPGVLGIQGEGLFIFRDLGRIVIYFQGFGEKA